MKRLFTYFGLGLISSLFLGCGDRAGQQTTIDFTALPETEQRLPENALASFKLADGLELQLFAHEPMLLNPTNLDIDERGRVWLCEGQNYRGFQNDNPRREGGDRIMILEDTDGDGQADTSKVFYQGTDVNAALGIAKLGSRVYVAASPNLLVFTDTDGDDRPDLKDTLFTGLEGVDHDHGVHALVFGPDGKLYFTFGNEGKRLRLKNGELAVDRYGHPVEEGKSFRQGMVFRCNPDGSDLEILGHNFRNNYEVALDSYGTLWQSDNDDDGNEGTRINYVMDYGNFGFKDEVTGAGWRQQRVGMHAEIPKRHWHLNDPGVVPNVLQTGAGSPTGMVVYEGTQLPERYRNEMIHCEPLRQIVRAYPVTNAGAGYRAEILPLIESQDPWFRPSDVCVAPDGSLLVTDWYDAGVGGHLMADHERGRVYRIHASGRADYTADPPDLGTVSGALAGLQSPNQATRYLAFQTLEQAGAEAVAGLQELLSSANPRMQARAFWLLVRQPEQRTATLNWAIEQDQANLRIAALRAARQYAPERVTELIDRVITDPEVQVRREAAISLRHTAEPAAPAQWAQLAEQFDGTDRWYLEALGIGAAVRADAYFAAYLERIENDLSHPGAKELVWRIRSPRALPLLANLIDRAADPAELARYVRAMHFHDPAEREPYLVQALLSDGHPQQERLTEYVLQSLDEEIVRTNVAVRRRVQELLPQLRGSATWLTIVNNASLRSELPYLVDTALTASDPDFRKQAAEILFKVGGKTYWDALFSAAAADPPRQAELIALAGRADWAESVEWLIGHYEAGQLPASLQPALLAALSGTWGGQDFLRRQLQEEAVQGTRAETIALALTKGYREDIRAFAIDWLSARKGHAGMPDIASLVDRSGDAFKGEYVFETHCSNCHQVNGEGVVFGPALDQIGTKLSTQGLYEAILYPSQGIGFGYEGYTIQTKDGRAYTGYIESQTETELVLRLVGGSTENISTADISERIPHEESLMTANLYRLMSEEELVDLIAYLQNLRAEGDALTSR
jgi:putative membrane-bound dehydrogenase-like protein